MSITAGRFACWCGVLLLVLCCLPLQAQGEENVLVNGDFENDLDGWTFLDASVQWPGSPYTAWSEAVVQGGIASIQSHYAKGGGILRQDFGDLRPGSFSFWWNLDGNCSSVRVYLVKGSERVLSFVTRHDSSMTSNSNSWVRIGDVREEIESSPHYLDNGRLEVVFDYDAMGDLYCLLGPGGAVRHAADSTWLLGRRY